MKDELKQRRVEKEMPIKERFTEWNTRVTVTDNEFRSIGNTPILRVYRRADRQEGMEVGVKRRETNHVLSVNLLHIPFSIFT